MKYIFYSIFSMDYSFRAVHVLFFLCIHIFISLTQGYDNEGGTITDDTLRKLLNKFKEFMGDNSQLQIPDQTTSINQPLINMNGSFINGTIEDPRSFSVDVAHVNMTTLVFSTKLSYEKLKIIGLYSIYGDNEWMHLEGAGDSSIEIADLVIDVYLKLHIKEDNTLQLEDFNVDYNMAGKVNFKYLGGSTEVSDTLNKLINFTFPEGIQATKPWVQKEAKNVAILRSQFFLSGMTLDQLIVYINQIINT